MEKIYLFVFVLAFVSACKKNDKEEEVSFPHMMAVNSIISTAALLHPFAD